MRVTFSAAVAATVAVALVTSVYAQLTRESGRDFSAAALTAPPSASWPTNGGNLYNHRYSPLNAVNRGNVTQLKGVWRARLRGSGAAPLTGLLARRTRRSARRRLRARAHG